MGQADGFSRRMQGHWGPPSQSVLTRRSLSLSHLCPARMRASWVPTSGSGSKCDVRKGLHNRTQSQGAGGMGQELRGHCVPFQTLVLPSQAGTRERKGVPRATILPEPEWGGTRLAEGLRHPAGLLQTPTPRRAAERGFPPGLPRSPQRAKRAQKKEPFGLRRPFVITSPTLKEPATEEHRVPR